MFYTFVRMKMDNTIIRITRKIALEVSAKFNIDLTYLDVIDILDIIFKGVADNMKKGRDIYLLHWGKWSVFNSIDKETELKNYEPKVKQGSRGLRNRQVDSLIDDINKQYKQNPNK